MSTRSMLTTKLCRCIRKLSLIRRRARLRTTAGPILPLVSYSSLDEAISSLPAALCSVTCDTLWIALETSSAFAACWTVAVAISAIFAAVDSTPSMICWSDLPVSSLS